MTREIKFRVWYAPKDFPHIMEMHYFGLDSFDHDDGSSWVNTNRGILYYYEMLECPVMQFTGLHDKNGKEIYEGDIVKYKKNNRQVMYHFGCFVTTRQRKKPYAYKELWNMWSLCEVIGDIYSTPTLLSVKPKK